MNFNQAESNYLKRNDIPWAVKNLYSLFNFNMINRANKNKETSM